MLEIEQEHWLQFLTDDLKNREMLKVLLKGTIIHWLP